MLLLFYFLTVCKHRWFPVSPCKCFCYKQWKYKGGFSIDLRGMITREYIRAVVTGPVSPVSTGPLFPSHLPYQLVPWLGWHPRKPLHAHWQWDATCCVTSKKSLFQHDRGKAFKITCLWHHASLLQYWPTFITIVPILFYSESKLHDTLYWPSPDFSSLYSPNSHVTVL